MPSILQVIWNKKLSESSNLQTGLKILIPKEQVYTILEVYFFVVQKQFFAIFFFKKMQMQTSFDNGKPNFVEGKWWIKSLGKFFSKISKEKEFFYPLSLHVKTVADWVGCSAQSSVFKKLPL